MKGRGDAQRLTSIYQYFGRVRLPFVASTSSAHKMPLSLSNSAYSSSSSSQSSSIRVQKISRPEFCLLLMMMPAQEPSSQHTLLCADRKGCLCFVVQPLRFAVNIFDNLYYVHCASHTKRYGIRESAQFYARVSHGAMRQVEKWRSIGLWGTINHSPVRLARCI